MPNLLSVQSGRPQSPVAATAVASCQATLLQTSETMSFIMPQGDAWHLAEHLCSKKRYWHKV